MREMGENQNEGEEEEEESLKKDLTRQANGRWVGGND
jgi:hypothetical protein